MKKPFAITGSVALKEAFVKEAGLSFYTNDSAKYKWIIPCENPENINEMQGIGTLPYNNSIAFSLPQQYEEAIEYVKTYWKEEFNVGDWIWNSEEGEVFQIEEINESKDACRGNGRDSCYYTLYTDSSKEYWSRKATPEEIKSATEFHKGDWVTVTKLDDDTWVRNTSQRTFQLVGEAPFYASNYEGNEHSSLYGLMSCTFRKATKEEIEEAQETCDLPKMSTYKAEIKEGKLHYGCKSFSKQEVQAIINAAAVLEKFSSYGASLSSTEVKTYDSSLSIEKLKTILNKLS